MRIKAFLNAFQRNERGVSALEYVILAAVVAGALTVFSGKLTALYTSVFATISTKITSVTQ